MNNKHLEKYYEQVNNDKESSYTIYDVYEISLGSYDSGGGGGCCVCCGIICCAYALVTGSCGFNSICA